MRNQLAHTAANFLLLTLSAHMALSQDPQQQRQQAITARLAQAKTFFDRMPPLQRKALSAGAQNFKNVAENWAEMGMLLRQPSRGASAFSDPALPDSDSGSVLGGRVHSESSTAWCGSNVVVAANDSGSVVETLALPGIGLSFNGFWFSTNIGTSFVDKHFMPPGTNVNNFLSGDPVVVCTDSLTFYQSSLLESTDALGKPVTEISVSKSTNGGSSFGNPIVVTLAAGKTHFLDKEWMAADPSNPLNLYVTFTDFDNSGAVCGLTSGTPNPNTIIKIAKSTNAGGSWGAPVTIAHLCGSPVTGLPFLQGSQVAVGSNGAVYVSWEFFTSTSQSIQLAKSTNGGSTFSPPVTAAHVHCTGDCFELQGNFRDLQFPALVLDSSNNPHIFWNDGTLQVTDALSFLTGKYGYADILTVASSNGGTSFGSPVRVNTNLEPLSNGKGTDQYQPAVAIDKTGKIGTCYYSRETDTTNYKFDRFCATSTNGGSSWIATRVTTTSSVPIHATDVLVNPFYMGDYDTLANDKTGANTGFIGSFEVNNITGNANLQVVKF
jgi:hypothetical protein